MTLETICLRTLAAGSSIGVRASPKMIRLMRVRNSSDTAYSPPEILNSGCIHAANEQQDLGNNAVFHRGRVRRELDKCANLRSDIVGLHAHVRANRSRQRGVLG